MALASNPGLPIPQYPKELNTWTELYRVYNTSESELASEISATQTSIPVIVSDRKQWADSGLLNIDGELIYYSEVQRETPSTTLASSLEVWTSANGVIDITPVAANDDEIWPTSGDIRIVDPTTHDEYISYTSVAYDGSGKVHQLLGCTRPLAWQVDHAAGITVEGLTPKVGGCVYEFRNCFRGISGTTATIHAPGTKVRGYVMAEHHNNIAQAIINLETNVSAMRDLITEMELVERPRDECPVAWFHYHIVETTRQGNYTVQFSISIEGDYSSFTFYFGDGTSVSDDLNPSHTYSPSATFDPSINVNSALCSVINTGSSRKQSFNVPSIELPIAISVEIPALPDLPDISIPTITPVENPEVVFPEIPDVVATADISLSQTISIPTLTLSIPTLTISLPTLTISIGSVFIPATVTLEAPTLITLEALTSLTLDMPTMTLSVSPTQITLLDDLPTQITLTGDIPTVITVDFSGLGEGEAPDCVRIIPCTSTPT